MNWNELFYGIHLLQAFVKFILVNIDADKNWGKARHLIWILLNKFKNSIVGNKKLHIQAKISLNDSTCILLVGNFTLSDPKAKTTFLA